MRISIIIAIPLLMMGFGFELIYSMSPGASLSFSSDNLPDRLVESCNTAVSSIRIGLDSVAVDTLHFRIHKSGTALDTIDYISNLPDTVIFLPGEQTKVYNIEAVPDTLSETYESIIIELFRIGTPDMRCDLLEIGLIDTLDVRIRQLDQSDYCIPGKGVLLTGVGAANYIWTAPGLFADLDMDTVVIDTSYAGFVYLLGTGVSCQDMDSVFIRTFDPSFEIFIRSDDTLCRGDALIFDLVMSQEADSIHIAPDSILLSRDSLHFVLVPEQTAPIIISSFLDSCSYRDTIFAGIEQISPSQIIADSTICLGDTIVLAAVGSDSTISYSWTPGIGLSDSTIAAPLAFPIVTRTYTRIATGALHRCADTSRTSITVRNSSFQYQISDKDTICPGEQVLATLIANDTGALISISPNTDIVYRNDSLFFRPTSTTNYTIQVSAGDCTSELQQVITVIDTSIDLRLLSWDTICTGSSVTLQLKLNDPRAEITWLPAEDVTQIDDSTYLLHPQTTKSIQYQIDYGLCTRSGSVDVFVIDNAVNFEQLDNSNICLGDSLLIKVSYDTIRGQLLWSNPSIIRRLNDSIYAVLPLHSDVLILTIDFEACSFTQNIDISVIDPYFEIETNDAVHICQDDTVQLRLSTIHQPVFYSLSPPQFGSIEDSTALLYPLSYTEFSIYADLGACIVEKKIEIDVDSLPALGYSIIPQKEVFCIGDQVELIPEFISPPQYPNLRFNWSPNDDNLVSNPSLPSARFEVQHSSIYTRQTVNGACTQVDTFVLLTTPKGISTGFRDTTICAGQSVRFQIFDTDISRIDWSPGTGLSCTNCPDPLMRPTHSQIYTLSYQRDQCTYSVQVDVNISPKDTLIFPTLYSCRDSTVQLDVDNTRFVQGIWDDEPELSCLNCLNPFFKATASKTYVIRDFSGLCELVGLQEVIVYPEVDASIILLNTDDIFIGQTISLRATAEAANAIDYQWYVNGVLSDQTGESLDIIAEDFNYTVELIVTDQISGCTISKRIQLLVKAIDEIKFPNTFTPNGDGRNDVFKPALAESLRINYMSIYNRWGQQVFNSTAADAAWDGRDRQGNDLPTELYIYLVELTRPNGTIEKFRGEIHLIR